MNNVTEEDKQKVLLEVGMRTISHAVQKEGMLIYGPPSLQINWYAATTWAKMMAHDYGVTEDVLTAIIVEHLKARAIEAIQKYE
jgi:hypothetical protein